MVHQYTDDKGNSILHLVKMSEIHDHNAFTITQKLINDFKFMKSHKQIRGADEMLLQYAFRVGNVNPCVSFHDLWSRLEKKNSQWSKT